MTYAFRFGERDVWKIGYAQNLSDRLNDVNKHVPREVLGERWSITTLQQRWPTQTEAYEMEQRLLGLLAARRTVGERVCCTEDELQAAWVPAGSRADGPAAKVASAGPMASV
jgi:T5orf172 domain